jgi:DICT domain-containing protein
MHCWAKVAALPMVLATVQRHQNFTAATRRRYLDMATTSPLVAIFGDDVPADLGPGIRGIHLDPSDPLRAEWTVLALGAQTAAALIARECDDQPACREGDRLFDFTITYDRSVVTAAARNLLARMH